MAGKLISLEADGSSFRAWESSPEGDASAPGVVLLMDGMGFRPTLFPMAERIAAAGYRVVVPDLFHRIGPDVHFDPKVVFSTPDGLATLRKTLGGLTTDHVMSDVAACMAHLDSHSGAKPLGFMGYCMGGRFAFIAAARFPERIAAVASIHGGNLVMPTPESPHLASDKVRAELWFGIAEQDSSFTPENEATLRAALEQAGAKFEMEHFTARHGWSMADSPVHSPTDSETQFQRVISLFGRVLKRG